MFGFFSSVTKILIASLLIGAVLRQLDLSAATILEELGLTPDNVFEALRNGVDWALPNIILGAMIVVPVWLVVFLLRPPKGS